ncbi:MAG TPA: hypothetical protein VI488_09315 [Candidatus Angelobacter sp.]
MRFFRSGFLLAFPMLLLAGCSGFILFSNGRALVVVTVNPSFADPLNFPNLQVQFSASGTFNAAPTPVNPLPSVIWTVDLPAFSTLPDPGHASISQTGLAQCTPGFAGVVQVIATAPANPTLPLSSSNQMSGVAQMNCP